MIDSVANIDMPRPAEPSRRDSRREVDFNQALQAGTASDAAPGEASEHEGNLLEVQLVDRDGQALAILLPWRLAANGALSQWFATRAGIDGVANAGPPDATRAGAMGAQASAVTVPQACAPASPMIQAGGVPAWAPRSTSTSPHATDGSGAPAPAALSTLAEPWQARLLRWLRNNDDALTARLRDYRLDAADEARFVERTVAFARENGLALQRIVVNAREVWRAW